MFFVSIYSIIFLIFSSFLFFSYNFCFSSAIVSLISLYVFTINAIIIKTAAIKTTVSSKSFKYMSFLKARNNFNKLSFFDHIFLLSIIFCFNISFSQQKSITSTITLSEVVINSLKNSSNYSLTPFSVTKINFENQQQLKQQTSFDEYINNVPSLFALNANNFAQDLRVSIRGFGSRAAFGIRGIKVIVDGIPETTPDGQGQIDNLPLSLIKNIEILRGPSSSIYGNASGGVIYISTLDSLSGGSSQFRSTIGSYGMKLFSADVQIKGKKTLALFHQNLLNTEGFRDHSKLRQRIFNLKVRHKFSKNTKLDWQFNYTNSPLAQDPGSLDIESVKNRRFSRQRNKDYNAGEKINHLKTGFNLKTSLRNKMVFNNYIFYSHRDFYGKLPFKNGGIIDLDRNYYGFGSSLDLKKENNKLRHKIKLGIEYLSQEDQRDRYENLMGDKGVITFSQLELFKNFGTYFLSNFEYKNLFIQSGLRYDNQNIGTDSIGNDIKYNSINPSLGISYLIGKKSRVFINFSTSFESPSLSELSSNPSGKEGLNKNLNPSKAKNHEIGWKFFGTKTIVETTLFYIKSSNELLPYELEEFPGRSFYRNSGSSARTGIEISYKRTWKNFTLNRSLSYAKYVFDNYIKRGNDLSGNDIPGIPSKMSNVELNYNNKKGWQFQFNYNNVGKFYAEDENKIKIDSYTIYNIQSSKTFYNSWGEILISGGIKNIFNNDYYDNIRINAFGGRYYEAAPGRNFFTSLTIKLL